MKKKLINLFCTLVLMVTMLPMAVFAAETDTGKALQLVDNGTAANISGWNIKNGYNYIYYGQWNGSPVKWRVLDDQTNTGEKGGLFLLSDVLLGTGKYGDVYFNHTYSFSNAWQYGDAQAWCKAFESNNLDKREAAAILETTKSDKRYTSRTYNILFDEAKNILNATKFFSYRQKKWKMAHTVLTETHRVLPIMVAAPLRGGCVRLTFTLRVLRALYVTMVLLTVRPCPLPGLLVPLLI